MDAEYYQPIYLELENELKKYNTIKVSSVGKVTDGEHGSVELLNDGIKYLTAENIKKGYIETKKIRYVSKEVDERNKRARVQVGDILVSIKGTLGEVAVAEESLLPANMNRDVAIIKKYKNDLIPEYIGIFLMSRIGNLQSIREGSGGVQQMITLGRLRNIKIPILSKKFQLKIKYIFLNFNLLRNKSMLKYEESENILISEIGLNDWKSKHRLTFIKHYSDIKKSERIDAEYYQPKYEEIEDAVKRYEGGFSTIQKEFHQNKSTLRIEEKKLYKYVEIGSINVANGEITPNNVLGVDLPANAKRILHKNDVIISKVRTYRGAIAIVEEDGFVGSGAFTVLQENGRINKETLLTFLHSKPLLAWSLKPNTGTSYPVIVDDDILNLPIPILPKATQTQIQQKVIESFNLRKQSKHLLESAKRAVEIAIEQDEQSAITWLENQTQEITAC